jgi:hypothetical protein
MRVHISGTFCDDDRGAWPGKIIDVADEEAHRMVRVGQAELVEAREEQAVPEPSDLVETAIPKKKVGRPRKAPEWHDDDAAGFKPVEQQ